MMMAGFLANIANNFRSHYLQLANTMQRYNKPAGFNYAKPSLSRLSGFTPVDSYQPSLQPERPGLNEAERQKNTPVLSNTQPAPKKNSSPATRPNDEYIPDSIKKPATEENLPDNTYSFKRMAKLDYKLDMRFDLRAILSTARSIADGEIEQVEEFAAAGFGFQADFAIKGAEITKSNLTRSIDSDKATRTKSIVKFKNRQAQLFAAQSRNFAVQSFTREAAWVRSSHDVLNNGSYLRTINRFAARFRMDGGFSFANLQRFHVQTNRVAEEIPDAAQHYVDTAGKVAQSGTNEMMATFFDAVDAYLDNAEDTLLDNVTGFFDQAAQELGFSGTMVDIAREHLTGAIETFFNRVDTAMSYIESQFVPADMIQPTLPATPPVVEPVPDVDPAIAQDSQQLATA